MTLDTKVTGVWTKMKESFMESTFYYKGESDNLKKNAVKLIVGAGIGLYLQYAVKGWQPIITEGAFLYSGIKAYQCLRDWWS